MFDPQSASLEGQWRFAKNSQESMIKHDDVNMQASQRHGSLPWTTLDVSLQYKPRDLVSTFEKLNWRHCGVATKSPILNVTRCCKPSEDYLPGEFWNHPSHPPRKINKLLKSRQNAQWNCSFQFLLQKKDIKHPDTPSPLSFLSQATAITLSECSLCFLLWNRTTQWTSICFLPDCTIHNKL